MHNRIGVMIISLAVAATAPAGCSSAEAPQGDAQQAESADAPAAAGDSPEVPVGAEQSAAGDAPALENTLWRATRLATEMIVHTGPQGEPTLTLDPQGMLASGTGGCNQYGGTYTLDAEADRLSFGPLTATRMMCPEGMDVETAFVDAMGQARTYALSDESLELYNADGALVVRFEAGS